MAYPALGLLFAKGIDGFSDLNHHQRHHDGDRTARWMFIIALVTTCMTGVHNYMFAAAAAKLTAKVRSLCFKAILRQDGEPWQYSYNIVIRLTSILPVKFFDKDENSTGGLTSSLSDNAQKINGLAGVTLGT
jgi:ATP-binding cassette subfamily B (MDR/TAP) protein 1